MESIHQLLLKAEGLGVQLWAENGELRFRCRHNAMPQALLMELRECKPALLDYLQRRRSARTAAIEKPAFRRMPASLTAAPVLRQSLWNAVKSGELGVESANSPHHVFQISRPIDPDQIERGVQALIDRHPVLCTRVAEVAGQPWLYYDAERPRFERYDLSGHDEHSRSDEVARLAAARVWEPFDVYRGPLFRVFLITSGPADHLFGFIMHHFISDGSTAGIISSELTVLCSVRNAVLVEDSTRVEYRDYLLGMAEWLETSSAHSQFQFWEERLAKIPRSALIPAVNSNAPTSIESLDIDADLTTRLRSAARRLRTSIFVILVAVQKVVCARLTGETDITVGTVTTGRDAPVLEPVIGYLADRVLYRSSLAGNPTFAQIVERERATIVEALPYHFARFDILRQRLARIDRVPVVPFFNFFAAGGGPVRRPAGWSLFRVASVPSATIPTLRPETLLWSYWMTLEESATDIRGRVRYNGDPIPGLVDNFKHILTTAVDGDERRLGDFSLLLS